MTKNLSKQLCELCGVERKGKLIFRKRDWDGRSWISAGCGYKEFDFKSIPETSVDIIPTKDYKETNGFQYPYTDIEKIKKIYNEHGYDFVEFRQNVIDFTSPENFVRLFKLITTLEYYSYDVGNYYIPYIPTFKQISCLRTEEAEYTSENIDPIEAFLTCVIKCAIKEKDTADYIKETEWKYE